MLKKLLPVLSLPLLLMGCSTPFHATNLTSLQQVRSTNNLYTLEVAVASRQQTLRWETLRPQIAVGNEYYSMRPVLLMTNRWEGLLPVPPGTSTVHYRYKFDFKYNAMGAPRSDSFRSSEYTLRIVE